MPTIKSKVCTHCKEMKDIKEFPKLIMGNRRSGLCYECSYAVNEKKKICKPSKPMRNKRST